MRDQLCRDNAKHGLNYDSGNEFDFNDHNRRHHHDDDDHHGTDDHDHDYRADHDHDNEQHNHHDHIIDDINYNGIVCCSRGSRTVNFWRLFYYA